MKRSKDHAMKGLAITERVFRESCGLPLDVVEQIGITILLKCIAQGVPLPEVMDLLISSCRRMWNLQPDPDSEAEVKEYERLKAERN